MKQSRIIPHWVSAAYYDKKSFSGEMPKMSVQSAEFCLGVINVSSQPFNKHVSVFLGQWCHSYILRTDKPVGIKNQDSLHV